MTDFATLGLSAPVLDALVQEDFTTATEIQAQTIPLLLSGRDVVGLAQTGSGKTGAFVLPMIERLMQNSEHPKPGMPRALILAPTRELAIQITDAIKTFSRHTKLRNCTIFGGAPYRTQIHILRRGVDILVATPGRLLDHMKQGNIYLDEVEYFVLDEADRMLDMGFVDDVSKISANIRCEHQSVMFSATLNEKIKDLSATLLKNPARVEITPQATVADNLTHKVMFVARHDKHDLLLHMIEEKRVYKALVFVRTKREADELAAVMEAHGLKVDSIHGDKQQRQRERIIRSFRNDNIDFLVATDVAARGIDVKDIGHVFNIDVPVEAESYVHRIGRTARGGKSGEAFTFCSKNEFRLLQAVERVIKMRIEIDHDHPFPQQAKPSKGKAKVQKRPFGDRPEGTTKKRKDRKDRTPIGKQTKHRKGQSSAAKAAGKPLKSRPAQDTRDTRDTRAEGRPASGKPAKGKPAFGKPAKGKSAQGKSALGKPKGKPAKSSSSRGSKPFAKTARPKKAGGGFDTLKRRA
ncbi:DEAD/DEAH box helicase [Kordiimonas lacus]|uniref:ATP-dependent RNA helicase RhlE n=1 Tax=Kordiimonas lacus TaxID=637679 RepID=A0A1G6TY60_9PROT|nr:DEAD/DEAH box helicase [Kordiimonas lacus]SDD33235.1 ATP-dependent RNA helicase RhlE [Kordiimonas lacus]